MILPGLVAFSGVVTANYRRNSSAPTIALTGSSSGRILVIAEKPSVARDLARVLGVTPSGKTFFESPTHVVSWCVGHLVELDEPASYDSRWKTWRMDTLPMLPDRFKLKVSTGAPTQFRALKTLLLDKRFSEVINACDAGREGELIFRYVYELSGSKLPIKRLWVSSLTDEAVRKGFSKLEPGSRYDRLADAARCRSEADWLVGLNATRAVTMRAREGSDRTLYSIGRVQTPTLALLVRRDDAIANFVEKDYWQIRGDFLAARGQKFFAHWSHKDGNRLATESLANSLIARCSTRARDEGAIVEWVQTKRVREAPPALFDLTSLQRVANKRFGMSAAKTLEIAQALYERQKVLTYPRTDSKHLSSDMKAEVPSVLSALAKIPDYAPHVAPFASGVVPTPSRIFNDKEVSDHHAIIPTGKIPTTLSSDERKIFDCVARRFIAAFHPDAEFDETRVVVRVGPLPPGAPVPTTDLSKPESTPKVGPTADTDDVAMLAALPAPPDRFSTRGRVRIVAGWLDVLGIAADSDKRDSSGENQGTDSDGAGQEIPKLVVGEKLEGMFSSLKKRTRPPPRYSEATLLSAMEFAGRAMDDEALRNALRERGLGTPATRASIIETLLDRKFIRRDGRTLAATPLGAALVHSLPVQALASAEMTGEWEARLTRIERGEDSRAAFMGDIATFLKNTIESIKSAPIALSVGPSELTATAKPLGRCPKCGSTVIDGTADYRCALGPSPCGLSIPKRLASREISPELAAVLLRYRTTKVLRGFKSRAGKRFAAAIQLRDDGSLTFVFESGARGTADETAEPTAPSLRKVRTTLSAARDSASAPPGVALASTTTAEKPDKSPTKSARKLATVATPATMRAADSALSDTDPEALIHALNCPKCIEGRLITGKRGWGCSRWKEGCDFKLWFECAGRKLTSGQVQQLVTKGKTRAGLYRPGNGPPVKGRLMLDVTAADGCARFERVDDSVDPSAD